MNLSTILGFVAAIVVFFATVFLSLQNSEVLLDGKSALMVVGGTFAVSVVCFSLKKILLLLEIIQIS